ncbi:putative zinc finger protein [Lutibacter sp. Hel_I_33_5]|uniref:HEAT repeat domain-containing protein n=1 Tax=Lutibacter sp. Hel_I_33_5 TaxID=1566289 RepID=UPI0011AAAD7B|nr:zf-HC2 domain-containing protein [Lutibacter sp. Hel_I_33_5]TVZ55949.1 putative zinc finger protein [Lutibacter sp. Hel_I_33_5]
MDCKITQDKLVEYLEKNVSKEESVLIENHLKTCYNCTKELTETKQFLSSLDSDIMEQPSSRLKNNFEKLLAEEIKGNQTKVIPLESKRNWSSFLRIAAMITVVLSAFLLGKYQSEIGSDNQQKVLALLENTSASKRILAVSNAENFNIKDTKIIDALINRLFFDKNTNVRLAAAEALFKFSSELMVRDALIKSLETDKNTSVQIEVIQILSKIQEKRAVLPMRKMLNNEETPQYVKQQLELNLSNLL